ncbi:hypothetical protein OG21DRAFT_1528416, partial [Imleria badia]
MDILQKAEKAISVSSTEPDDELSKPAEQSTSSPLMHDEKPEMAVKALRTGTNTFAKDFKKKYQFDILSGPRATFCLAVVCERLKKIMSANSEAPSVLDLQVASPSLSNRPSSSLVSPSTKATSLVEPPVPLPSAHAYRLPSAANPLHYPQPRRSCRPWHHFCMRPLQSHLSDITHESSFDIEAWYMEPRGLPGSVNPWIAQFSAKGIPADPHSDLPCVEPETRLNLHGIMSFEAAYVEDVEKEVAMEVDGDAQPADAPKK